ncbi:MAG: hypothetical protein WCR52_12595 [Bacteroidota bacterium]
MTYWAALSFVLLSACNDSSNKKDKERNEVTSNNNIPIHRTATLQNEIKKDSIEYADSTEILGKTYIAIYTQNDTFCILNEKSDTLFIQKGYTPNFEFVDFNKDGLNDIRFYYMTMPTSVEDLLLFDKTTMTFKEVENFRDYPGAVKLGKTKYYYAYQSDGCDDMNWHSDLFYIGDFKIYKIGTISGRECFNRDEKDGIYIRKISNTKEILTTTLPIQTLRNYKKHKWGFIKDYWLKNYNKFI